MILCWVVCSRLGPSGDRQETTRQLGVPFRMAREGNLPRRQPPWLIIAVLAGWLLIIVVGAGPVVDDSLLGVAGLDDVWTALFLTVMFMCLVFVILIVSLGNKFTPPAQRKRRGRAGLIALAVLLLLLWQPDLLDFLEDLRLGDEQADRPAETVNEFELPTPGESVDRGPIAQVSDIALLVAALVGVAVLWWVVRRRLAPDLEPVAPVPFESPQAELAGAVGQAAVVLDAEDDPRLGVLKAYAILEATLADQGTVRKRSETPREHLQRALRELPIDTTSLLALADLYEMARFSEHEVTVAHRDQASRLLNQAQSELLATGAH